MGTDYWRHAIEKEMSAAGITFKFINDRPIGHTDINCHPVFDLKIGFNWKACYVDGGHLTDPPENVPTYASSISRESVRILFIISDLYNIKILAADISNVFLNDQCVKKNCFKAGPEFKSHEGMCLIIVQALYSPKSAGAFF